MELGQIEAFERAAREGNFTRAAEAMQLTQPAVSTRVSLLEAELGGPLFERRGRELKLTPLGEHFLPYARRMLAVMADGLEEVRNYQAGKIGQVRIAAPTPFVLSFLIETLEQFRRLHSTVDVLIRERNKTAIIDMLHDNTITLGLVNAPLYDLNITHLARFRDPIRAVVAVGHSLDTKKAIPIETIYNHTVFRVSMFPQMTNFMDEVVEYGRSGSGGAVIAVPMVMALRLVSLGQGLTFLPESYVKPAVDAGQLVMIDIEGMPPLMSEPILIALKDRSLDHIHVKFINIMKKCWQHLLI